MSSIKVVLIKHKKRDDGSYPIAIRITKNRKSVYNFLGYYIKDADWDAINKNVKKSHPNSSRLNNLILKKLSEASETLLESSNTYLSPIQIKSKIKNPELSSFFSVAADYLNDLEKMWKHNQLSGEKPRIKHFREFLENQDINFQTITLPLLKKFMVYLKSKRNIKERTIVNHLVVIRSVFNRAINLGIVESKYYPFGPGKIQIKFPESLKVGLNEKEVMELEQLKLDPFSPAWHARNIWICSFYLAGIRVSDIIQLKHTDFIDGRLFYVMGKNKKVVSLKTPDKASAILNTYLTGGADTPFIFPYLKQEYKEDPKTLNRKVRIANSIINKELKDIADQAGINKNLTMHISRHTFGQIAGDKIPPQLLQKLYRHSDLKTTIGYQANFIHKDVDKALDDILKF